MYPSQTSAPEGRHAAGPGMPGQPRMVGMNPMGGSHGSTPVNALASFVTYVKALESLDRRRFPDEYATHSDRIKELKPFLRAHGILDVMEIKNPEVAALLGV